MCFSINFGLFDDWLAVQMFNWPFYKLDDCLVELVIYYLFGGTFTELRRRLFVDPVENIDFQTSLKLSVAISRVTKLNKFYFWYTTMVGRG